MNWLENMILQTKLILLTGLMVTAMIILGVLGFKATDGWQSDIYQISEVSVPSVLSVGRIRNGAQNVAIQQNRVRGLQGDPKMQSKMVDASEKMAEGFERIDSGIKDYEAVSKAPEETKVYEKIQGEYKSWREQSEKFKQSVDTLAKASDPAEIAARFVTMGEQIDEMRASRTNMLDGIQKIYDLNRDEISEISKNATEQSSSFKQMFMTIAILSIVFALLLAWALIRSITRSITASVTSIRDGAMQITSASDQVASSSSSLAQGAS